MRLRTSFFISAILLCFSANAQNKNGHEYVNLGLPSGNLWATCNMGASSPTGYGDYYAWGELSPKSRYDWSTYKFYGAAVGFLKYNETDGLTVLEPEDDVANVKWGGNWQIPSTEDWEELLDNVDIYSVYDHGVRYYSLESKRNSGKLIIPLNRFKSDAGDEMIRLGCCLWLSSLTYDMEDEMIIPFKAEDGNAYAAVSAPNDEHKFNDFPLEIARCNGAGIRPVYHKTPKLSKQQRELQEKREQEERLRKEREERESEVVPVVLTSYRPIYPGAKDYSDSYKAFVEFIKDKIGRDEEYLFTATVYIGKDGRVYDAVIYKQTSGPDNLESRFKRAALSSPAWTPAKDGRGDYVVRCSIVIKVKNP